MYILSVSFICALLGVVPLLVTKRFIGATIVGIISFVIIFPGLYIATPSTVWPLWGMPGIIVLTIWICIAGYDVIEDEPGLTLFFPAALITVYLFIVIAGSGIFRADDYKNMVGTVEERIWTQDVQPKDPKHMRMATSENAIYQAMKVLGEAGAIGSQFAISKNHMTLQMIHNELWYVVPLDYNGFSVWTSTNGVPGYIMVHGEDPFRQPIIKLFQENEKMRFTPGAFFNDNLERHLRNTGYLDYGLTDCTFEIDEQGKAWWVITVFKPTIAFSGEKVIGVAIVDPISGDSKLYKIGKIPGWVDRAVPKGFVEKYFDWNGQYVNGWLNSWWGKKNLTQAETPILIYGSNGQPEWVTGITSKNSKDDSLVALVYTNSRTGKSIRYNVKGGATDGAVLDAVNKNNQVQFKKLHGVSPQLYNVYGTMASVVPLLNESYSFQGVAIVAINNIQTVAVGKDQYEALREYEKLISRSGQQITLDKERKLKTVEGLVDRFNSESLTNGTVYYIHVSGVPHIFTGGSSELSPKLPLTKIGDRVKIGYYSSGRDVVPIYSFNNLSLVLSETVDQKEVREKAGARKETEETKQDAATVKDKIDKMSPAELKALGEKIKK